MSFYSPAGVKTSGGLQRIGSPRMVSIITRFRWENLITPGLSRTGCSVSRWTASSIAWPKKSKNGSLSMVTPQERQARKNRRRTQNIKNAADLKQRGNKNQKNRVSLLWGRHEGMDAFVVGTGTSLSGFDWSLLNSRRNAFTIGLNDAILAAGWSPDYSIFCDVGIWKRYKDLTLDPKTVMVCQPRARAQFLREERCSFKDQVWHFNHAQQARACAPLSDDLYVARTVATGGIMLAYKLGARRVFLMGVDGYKVKAEGVAGGVYYHDGRSKGLEGGRQENKIPASDRLLQDRHEWWEKNMNEMRQWLDGQKAYQGRWRDSGVYNLSPLSTITAWEKVNVAKVFGRGAFNQ